MDKEKEKKEEKKEKDLKEDTKAVIGKDGIKIVDKDGTLVAKDDFMDLLEITPDDYTDLEVEMDEKQLRKFKSHLLGLKTGHAAMVPIMCGGPKKCPFITRCPFGKYNAQLNKYEGKFPIARQCPMEVSYLYNQRKKYIIEYDVEPTSATEVGLINKLSELDLYDYRCSIILSSDDTDDEGRDLLKRQTVGFGPEGQELNRLEVHPIWEVKQQIQRQRMDILQALVGTRREKYKKQAAVKERDEDDPSTRQAKTKRQLEAIIDADYQDVADKKENKKE